MTDIFDTPVGSMNFDPSRARPKDGTTTPAPTPATKPGGTATPGATPSPGPSSYDLNGQPIWGTSGGILYQYGRDSTGRDTFGPATDEAGNPLGNQDNSMIGSQDPRYSAASAALAKYPGYAQVRVNQRGAVGGYLDPSQLVYDPTVGLITPIGNINQGHDNTGLEMAAVMFGGPLLGAAGNALAGVGEAGGAVAGSSGALDTGGIITGGDIAGGATGGAAGAVGDAGGALGAAATPGDAGALPTTPDFTIPTYTPPDVTVPPPDVTIADTGVPPIGSETPPPSAVADNLTPTINDMVTSPPPVADVPTGGTGVDGPVGFPTDTGPFSTPDFNVPMQPPPDVSVPPPDVSIDSPWYQPGIDAVSNHPFQAAGLGLTAFNALNRPKPPTIPSTVPDANKPVINQAITDIMNKGALSGDQQHSIDDLVNRHIKEGEEALKQRAINSGMGANSMVVQQQLNQFRQNAEQVREQMYQQQMQQNIGNAIQIWAEGNREDIAIQTAAANLEAQNNARISQLNTSIAQSLGWLYTMGNSRTTPSTPPGG